MKVFVWRGGDVLRNYSTGLVVILAESAEQAWEKLKAADEGAFWQLSTGYRFTEMGAWMPMEQQYQEEIADGNPTHQPGFPIQPESFEINEAPVLHRWGGE